MDTTGEAGSLCARSCFPSTVGCAAVASFSCMLFTQSRASWTPSMVVVHVGKMAYRWVGFRTEATSSMGPAPGKSILFCRITKMPSAMVSSSANHLSSLLTSSSLSGSLESTTIMITGLASFKKKRYSGRIGHLPPTSNDVTANPWNSACSWENPIVGIEALTFPWARWCMSVVFPAESRPITSIGEDRPLPMVGCGGGPGG
mmetsp:Transcript_68321/g.181993  ORF Transcript_68321/g.181993 Transcript_68321/m.181993 type:complete len:202 (+) Transcript_68321:129-734(+)